MAPQESGRGLAAASPLHIPDTILKLVQLQDEADPHEANTPQDPAFKGLLKRLAALKRAKNVATVTHGRNHALNVHQRLDDFAYDTSPFDTASNCFAFADKLVTVRNVVYSMAFATPFAFSISSFTASFR